MYGREPAGCVRFFTPKKRRCIAGNNHTALMADLKFRCPECTQKIAVNASAAGVKIDCPTCHSRLVIPRTETSPVEVLVKRKLAIVGGSADEVYAELQKAQVQAEKATDELEKLKARHTAELQEAKKVADALQVTHAALEKEGAALRPLRGELAAVKKDLTDAAEREKHLKGAAASAAKLLTELTGMQATFAETQNRLITATEQLAAVQHERDQLSKEAAATAELREQLADARKEIERATKDAETAITAHAAQLDGARGIETGVRAELAAVQTRHAQAESRLAEQAATLTKLETERTELTGVIEELLPLRAQLEKSQRDLCAICETHAEKARGHESELEAAKNSEAALRASLGDLQSRHEVAQKQIAEHSGRVEVAMKRVAELQPEAASAKQLRENLAAAQGDLERIRNEAEQAATEREAAARKDADAVSKARAAEKTLREYADGLNAKLADLERRNAVLAIGFSAIKQEHGDLTGELAAMRTERDAAAALSAGHAKEIANLKPAAQSAAGELAKLSKDADAAAAEKKRIAADLEMVTAEHKQALERNRQQAAAAAASTKEIERLTQLAESAQAAAKAREPLPQPPASLRKAADSKALSDLERQLAETKATLERAQKAEREAAERAKKSDEEKAGLTTELSRKSAEFDSLKNEAAQVKAELDQIKSQPKESPAIPAATAALPANGVPADREKALETERDALAAALERAKQHVGVLQARRDMLRDEVATLRTRLGIGGKVTSGDEKPIAK